MKNRLKTFVFLSVFIFAVLLQLLPDLAYGQSGSYLESLYKASETGENRDSESPAVDSQNTSAEISGEISQESQPTREQYACQSLTASQLESYIKNIIQQILSQFGGGLGGKVIIIRIPKTVPPSSGGNTIPASTTVTPPSSAASTSATVRSTNTATSSTAGLKADIKAKYGITAADGDGAVWSQRQLEEADKVLATLPKSFISSTKTIQRDGIYRSPSVLGYVQMGVPTVHILNSACYQGTFQGTIIHEMTHCFQADHPQLTKAWQNQFWPNGRPTPASVSSYGNTQPLEDFAESVREYWQNGAAMKQKQPARYEFIKKNVMGGTEF